jgi:CelD/BcsL family acetyltransferase involved in cellulose biosynthesis
MHAMRLEVRDRLEDLQEPWDELVASQPLPTPFLASWWVENAGAGRTVLLCCLEGQRLVGGAAFEIDAFGPPTLGIERVRVAGQWPLAPDHLDVIAEPGRRRQVTDLVIEWLLEGNRVIDLQGLAAASELPRLLGARVLVEVDAPYVDLKGEDWAQHLPGRLRSTISRSRKRLERSGHSVRMVPVEQVDAAMTTLQTLHDIRWQEDSSFRAGWDRLAAIARAGAPSGGVVLHEMVAEDGTVIASEMELVIGSRVSFYQAGRLTDHELRGSGSVLRAAIVEWAHASGRTEFDLLRGAESYKDDWATGCRRVRRARRGVGARGRAASALANATLLAAPGVLDAIAKVAGEERTQAMAQRAIGSARSRGLPL